MFLEYGVFIFHRKSAILYCSKISATRESDFGRQAHTCMGVIRAIFFVYLEGG